MLVTQTVYTLKFPHVRMFVFVNPAKYSIIFIFSLLSFSFEKKRNSDNLLERMHIQITSFALLTIQLCHCIELSQIFFNGRQWLLFDHCCPNWPLARQLNCRLLNFSSALIFKVLQCHSKLVKMLYECENSFDPDERPSYSASHPDPNCSHFNEAV